MYIHNKFQPVDSFFINMLYENFDVGESPKSKHLFRNKDEVTNFFEKQKLEAALNILNKEVSEFFPDKSLRDRSPPRFASETF